MQGKLKAVVEGQEALVGPGEVIHIPPNATHSTVATPEEDVFLRIAQRGKGVPRIALRLLESVKMLAMSQNDQVVRTEHVCRICEIESIDPKGLIGNEVKYLHILYENDGSARLNVIASRLGIHCKHVSVIIEPFLIRDGLVTKNNSVRVLTQDGLNHLRQNHNGE